MRDFFIYIILFIACASFAQKNKYSHADSIKGTITNERLWWNALHYDIRINFSPSDSSIKGSNKISYKVLQSNSTLQLDLIAPMQIDSIIENNKHCSWKKGGDAYFIRLNETQDAGAIKNITAYFHGKPHVAKVPPWDGGVIWKKDKNNNPWISIACQGMAGSVWFPCKDHMYDEPDSTSLTVENVPFGLSAVSNGKLRSFTEQPDKKFSYQWVVTNLINNYNIIPYIGKYVQFNDTFIGEKGVLKLNYWVLEYNLEKAKNQFKQVKSMLRCFEYWFGPYPFYEDEYKLVEAPFLGMEHQSAVAYGNFYMNGYMGRDLSGTGWGLKWDFIVVHESGHEWFGNNITAKDVADNWIHEGFTSYAEVLFTECEFGKEAGNDYCEGVKKSINNDIPIIGKYDVREEGSGDMYNRGSQVVQMIRQVINDDEKFRLLLRDMNETFYHKTVSSKELETFIIEKTGIDFTSMFDQYLRTTQIPTLEYKIKKNKLSYKYSNCLTEFNIPVKIKTDKEILIKPKTQWQTINLDKKSRTISLDRNVYVKLEKVK